MNQKDFGKHFLLGFQGLELPSWLYEISTQWGLGGVILFDYSLETKSFKNNIQSKENLKQLTRDIHSLPGHPKVFIDQEGGKVRRLKESMGFHPLVSHKEWATWSKDKQKEHLRQSFNELKECGIDVNLGPVIDIDYNPTSPDIGIYDRSFSNSQERVKELAHIWFDIAKEFELELCLKHFPGLGVANTNSHEDITDISNLVTQEQENLFYELLPFTPGHHILLSHARVKNWGTDLPLSISRQAVERIREKFKSAHILTDDMQMKGLMKLKPLNEACALSLNNGIDMICIGNNLRSDESQMLDLISTTFNSLF